MASSTHEKASRLRTMLNMVQRLHQVAWSRQGPLGVVHQHVTSRCLDCRRSTGAFALLMPCWLVMGACSSSTSPSSGPACDAVASCGGDISGVWDIVSGCLTIESPFSQPECQVAVRSAEFVPTGTVTYAPSPTDAHGGTLQPDYRYRFTAREVYSAACLTALTFTPGTDDACLGLQVLWGGPIAVSCSRAEGGCACDFADEQIADQPADYALRDGQIVFSETNIVDYCRMGDSLLESVATDSSISRVTLRRRTP